MTYSSSSNSSITVLNPEEQKLAQPDSLKLNNQSELVSTQDIDRDWSLATEELIDSLPRVWTRGLLYFLIIFAQILLPWALLAKVDETGSARGRLEPVGDTIELDAGVTGEVASIEVEEGQSVVKGQTLLKLDSELVKTEIQQAEQKLEGQKNRLAQLELLKNQLLLSINTQQQHNQAQELEKQSQIDQARHDFESYKATIETEKAQLEAQLEQARQAIKSKEASSKLAQIRLKTAQEKVPRYKKAYDNGVIAFDRYLETVQSEKESKENLVKAQLETEQARAYLKEQESNYHKVIQEAEAKIEQAQLRFQEQQNSYQSLLHSGQLALLRSKEQHKKIETEITTLQAEIAETESHLTALELQLQQRVFKSPINGTIFELPITEAGEVVQPGEMLAQIAPQGATMVLRGEMPAPETGFVELGMPVKLKLDAYPFQDYGVVEGRLNWISPDSKVKETPQGQMEVFEIEVALENNSLPNSTQTISLTPGQTATAEILIRQRKVIDFVLDPFKKLQEGGLEI
ncbi:MAG: HlyD family efflux transporter periplasmic adaptor subunit [Xenococcaceae cyanobacterium]